MPIEIDKDVPPPKRSKRGRPVKYPFPEMEVGDSFVVDVDTTNKNEYNSIRSSIHCAAKRQGAKACYRTINTGQIRVWRVE